MYPTLPVTTPTWLIERTFDEVGARLHMVVGWMTTNSLGNTQPVFLRGGSDWLQHDVWIGCGGVACSYAPGEETRNYCVTTGSYEQVRAWLLAEMAEANVVAKTSSVTL